MKFHHLLSVGVCVSMAIVSHAFAADSMYVQVKSSKVRSQANYWSSPVATVSYGDALTKIGGDDPWWKVQTAKGETGYIPSSSVTSRKIVFGTAKNAGKYGIDQTEVVMAGKGFSKEVEKSFAATGQGNFAAVDAIERTKVSDGEVREFMKGGQLGGGK